MSIRFLKPRRAIVRLLLVFAFWAGFQASAAAQETKLTFGIVPQQAASKLIALWSPVLQYLSDKTGYEIVFKTTPDIPKFEAHLAAGEYDLAYMNPYHYVVFAENPGYRAFAKQKDKTIKGILVARKDSGIQGIEDLAGARLAFPSPAAFAASILPRASLRSEGIDFSAAYVSSHDSVYRNVAKNRFVAGGGIVRTFQSVDENVRTDLKVIWESKGYTPHAFAAHPRVPAEVLARVQSALITMAEDPEGREILAKLKFGGIEEAVSADWDDVRSLNIGALTN